MADAEQGMARNGRALRVYQIVLVLLVGWAAGRLPGWLDDGAAESRRMESALGLAGAAPAAATDVDTARLAAEVAARVAAQVADETIARLVAAGWAPGGGRGAELPPQRIILETRGGAPQESVVRVVTEAAQPSLLNVRYDLPGGSAAAAYSTVAPAMSPSAAAPAQPSPTSTKAHAAATAGYAAIRAGDLQEGVRLLKAAQAMDPDAPEAAAWGADVKQLTRRWSVGAYALSRAGTGEALAASPVLGGGQIGAAIAWRVNPLGKQRISIVGRFTAAAGPEGGIDSETGEAALGLRYEPFRSVPLAVDVERRFALGVFARDAWAARVSGGAQGKVGAFGRQLALEGYGEAGVVEGFTSTPDVYAGAQMRGAVPLFQVGRTRFDGGAGLWGAVQRSFDVTASRLDVGPSARIKVEPWPFHAQIDYRARVAGNALPGSGPVLTVAGEF
jgi:hypothetical protein